MRRRLIPVAGFVLFGGLSSIQAQSPTQGAAGPATPPSGGAEIRGTVVDAESNAAITAATVTVRSKADSSLVAGAIAGDNGAFRIQGLRPGTYYLRVTSIGYTPRTTTDFSVAEGSPSNVGAIKLTRFAVTLQSVEVTVDPPTVTIEPDRNTYRAKDVAPAASNASDVLQATPSVEVDADGRVSLRGNENVAIQINGRPAPVRGTQLAAYLRQLPASIVERVEVIPTPSARHDPEGMAGIINLVLKQNTDLGTSGGFTLQASPQERYSASGNVGDQRGKRTVFVSYGYNFDKRNILGINDRERFTALGAPLSYTEQDIDGEFANSGHNLNSTFDYKFNDRDLLTTTLNLNRRRSEDDQFTAFTEFDSTRSLLETYVRPRAAETKGFVIDHSWVFKRTFEARKHELSSELRFNRADDDDHTLLWRQSAREASPRTELEDDRVDALTQQATAQLDYFRPLGERTKLETGYKGTGRFLDRDFTVLKDSLGDGSWIRSNLSNAFEFDEQVHALYGVLSHGIGKFELQGGLRGEYARRDFALSAENFPHDYTSLFPSSVIMYKFSDASQAKLSYSRRIRRPGTQELNPFPVFFDVHNVFIGNPNLNPEYTDAFELSFNRSGKLGSIQVSPFYRRTKDVMRFLVNTADTVDGREVTTISFENLATGTSWGSDMNGSLRFGQRFNAFGGFNIFKMVTEGGSLSSLSSNAVTWSARINATTQITPTTTLQAFYMYRAPQKWENSRFSKFQMTSVTLRRKLQGDKSTLALRFLDPFNTMKFTVEAGDENVWQLTQRRWGARSMHLTYQYSFGQAPRARQPRIEPQQQEPQQVFPQ
jgi:ferric enterobactin receptor